MLSFLKGFSSGIQSKYSIGQESFRVGPWSVHDGKARSSGELVTVFVFDKSTLTKQLPQGVRKSVATQQVTDYAQRGVSELSKLRHPSVVRLIEPLETSSRSLMFVTERLTSSLETLISAKRNDSPGSEELNELAIERGALVLCHGLMFLHDTGRVHTNLCPSSVFVAATGDWKIGGLEFLSEPNDDFFFPDTDPRLPNYLRLDLDFLAPEVVLDHRLGPENDVWALASILYSAYTLRDPLDCRGNPNSYKEEYAKFARKLRTLPPLASRLGPNIINQLFARAPTERMGIGAFEHTDYFNHSLVKALQFLDDFETKSPSDKIQFLKYLSEILPQFPKAILRRKILTFAIKELSSPASDTSCTQQLANILFGVSASLSQLSFAEEILPLFKTLGKNPQFQEALVDNIQIVVDGTAEKNFVKEVVPVFEDILKGKENDNAQRTLLNSASLILGHITISCLEQKIFPLALDLFCATQIKSVKLACIGAFSDMVVHKLSTLLITDKLLPALQGMKTRDPAIVIAVKDLYEKVAEKTSSATLIEKILPHLGELSQSRDLTVAQFKLILKTMRDQLNNYETDQVKLLSHNREESNTFDKQALSSAPSSNTKDSFMKEAFNAKPPANNSTKASSIPDLFDSPAPMASSPAQPSSLLQAAPRNSSQSQKPFVSQAPVLQPPKITSSTGSNDFNPATLQPATLQSTIQPTNKRTANPLTPKDTLQGFSDDFGGFQSPGQGTTPLQPQSPAQSSYSSPFLVSSLSPQQPSHPQQQPKQQQWTPMQPLQPLQPTKKSDSLL